MSNVSGKEKWLKEYKAIPVCHSDSVTPSRFITRVLSSFEPQATRPRKTITKHPLIYRLILSVILRFISIIVFDHPSTWNGSFPRFVPPADPHLRVRKSCWLARRRKHRRRLIFG